MTKLTISDMQKLNKYIEKKGKDSKFYTICYMVLKSQDAEYIYEFARNVKGVVVSECQDAIIKVGDPEFIYKFARDVKGADRVALKNAIIKAKDSDWTRRYLMYIKINEQNTEKSDIEIDELVERALSDE